MHFISTKLFNIWKQKKIPHTRWNIIFVLYMKTYPLKHLIYLPFLFLCIACGSSKKTTASHEIVRTLPELPLSELDIPIHIAAAPVLAKAEKLVPSEFTSDEWPDFMHPSCDFRYKYRFVRTSLQISCVNNLISIR